MSLDTWKAEFYPIPAEEVAAKDAIQHSLTKWIGLRPENLSKHNLEIGVFQIVDAHTVFAIDSSACSLCARNPLSCAPCPIAEYKSTKSIYKKRTCCPEYDAFGREHDPEPMIDLLQQTINFQQTAQVVL